MIISIYDNVEFLKCILDALEYQTEQNFEIIISEDAEHAHVRDFIQNYPFRQPCRHITQKDDGWRKNKALNRAILAAQSDWLVFIDGDCVLHPRFMEFHIKYAEENRILAGKRVKLNPELTAQMLKDPSMVLKMPAILGKMFWGGRRGVAFWEEGFFINPRGIWGFVTRIRSMYQLKGCNMSFSRKAAMAINGFDEDFTAPCIGEDIDLVWRFEAAGFRLKSVRNLAVQYHLHHFEKQRDQSLNAAIMNGNRRNNRYVAENGLKKDKTGS